jgi:hypothetical protein
MGISKFPWLAMWVRPRSTIRFIIEKDPTQGIYLLPAVLGFENFFFYANMWSLGLRVHFTMLVCIGLVLCPVMGYLWIWIMSRIFYYTGHWLKGRASLQELRAAVAWSKIPAFGILLSWLGILALSPEEAFIQIGGGNPYIHIFHILNFIFAIWSIVLLIQVIREVENFSLSRSIVNVLLAWSLFSLPIILIMLTALFLVRY